MAHIVLPDSDPTAVGGWVHDSKTAPRFIKYNLMRAMAQQVSRKISLLQLRGNQAAEEATQNVNFK